MRKILLLGLLTACASADRVTTIEQELATLKQQVESADSTEKNAEPAEETEKSTSELVEELKQENAKLKEQIKALSNKQARAKNQQKRPKQNQTNNPAATKLLQEAQALINTNKIAEAKAKLTSLVTQFKGDRVARSGQKVLAELSVFGKDAPASLSVTKWLNNEKDGKKIKFAKGTTFVVFWELWCPHCKREVPKMDQLFKKVKAKGINVVGLTTLSKNRTEQQVNDFLKSKSITYPVAHHDGSINPTFAVRGIPAAAVVKDGKIVWRGHPGRITEKQLLSF